MESENFDLAEYLDRGVERIVRDVLRSTLRDPKESAFMLRYASFSKEAAAKRRKAEAEGGHVPPFLIASITSSCNLHCAGCYARHNHSCTDGAATGQLTDLEWEKIFDEARELGVGFILLAGGEPLLRRDVIAAAGKITEILFPIFTNGTMIDGEYIRLFSKHRNLVPIFSIEGGEESTDERRGEGVYERLTAAMDMMKKKRLPFGASVTVTTANLESVVERGFIRMLRERGCKVVFFVEYVPVAEDSGTLAPTDRERELLAREILALRGEYRDMLFVSFPGDEESMGGCLAAGRGFFHINSHGGAEPCPFSPYSDVNVRDTSIKEALDSGLFRTLRSEEFLKLEHKGGCALFEAREAVEALVKNI